MGSGISGILCIGASVGVEWTGVFAIQLANAVRSTATLDVMFGVRCGVELSSPGKRGCDFSVGRP